jgi:hypothetical protein
MDISTPFDPRQPFTRAQARAVGMPISQLIGPRYRKLLYDVYISAEVRVTPIIRAAAVVLISPPGSHASHATAARVWGGCVPDEPDEHVSVPPPGHRSRRRGVRGHVASPAARVQVVSGTRVSDPVQCVLDLAPRLGLVDLVVLGDSLVKAGAVTPAELVAAATAWRGSRAAEALRAMQLVRAGVDSPMESRLRMLVVLSGLPEPVVDHRIVGDGGRVRYRIDLSYPDWRIAIEYDGRQHAESETQWQGDIERREAFDVMDWRMIVVRSPGIYTHPGATLERIVSALRDRGVRGVAVRSDEWRRYFPDRAVAA